MAADNRPDDADRVPVPLDGDVLQYTGATASIAPERLGSLLREVQAHLESKRGDYRRAYECPVTDEERDVYLVPSGYWADLGADIGLSESEIDAVSRAHRQQLRRLGTKTDRREEFETALEIRDAVVVSPR